MYGIARILWRARRSGQLSHSGNVWARWITHGRSSRVLSDYVRRNTHRHRYLPSRHDLEGEDSRVSSLRERDNRSTSVKEGPGIHETVSAWNVANAVTVGRIVVAPLTGYWIVTGDYGMALGGLLYAGASDWLDGFLARNLHLRTVLGSYLDPAADKLLISTTTVCLAYQDVIPPWLAILIIGRDVALVVGWAVLLRGKVGSFDPAKVYQISVTRAIEPHFISKLNTVMQISLSFAGVISAGDWNLIGPPVIEGLGIAAALTTTSSGLSYGLEYWRQRNQPLRSR